MGKVDKLIFNALLSRQGVLLPGVGTLWVEWVAAAKGEEGEIVPPYNKVRFTSKSRTGEVSVVEMLGTVGEDGAREYDRWLRKARTPQGVVVADIGELKSNRFVTGREFERQLNPVEMERVLRPVVADNEGVTAPVVDTDEAAAQVEANGTEANGATKREKRRPWSTQERIWLGVIIISVAVMARAGIKVYIDSTREETRAEQVAEQIDTEADDEEKATAEKPGGTAEKSTMDGKSEPDGKPGVTAEKSTTDGKQQDAEKTTITGRYLVVGGMFTIPENADKYIAEMKMRHPELDYTKHPSRGGNTLVAIATTQEATKAQEIRDKLATQTQNPDIWVYDSAKK